MLVAMPTVNLGEQCGYLGELLLDRARNRWATLVAVFAPERAATASPLAIAHGTNSRNSSNNSIGEARPASRFDAARRFSISATRLRIEFRPGRAIHEIDDHLSLP